MKHQENITAIGLMSGTSLDGVDIAVINSNGEDNINIIARDYYKFSPELRKKISSVISSKENLATIKLVEQEFTKLNGGIVNDFCLKNNLAGNVDIIGFHGQTIYHNSAEKISWQIGDCQLLASLTGKKVVGNFRNADLINGGKGAPLVPIYHFYLANEIRKLQNGSTTKAIAIVNIGGISNISYCEESLRTLQASDICFGNSLFDDLVSSGNLGDFDLDGKITLSGKVDYDIANKILDQPIFSLSYPISFDRNDFNFIIKFLEPITIADKLATIAFVYAKQLANFLKTEKLLPNMVLFCGGGRKNIGLIKAVADYFQSLAELRNIALADIDDISSGFNFNGDSLEAEAFAFLAIRSLKDLPISFPLTTGVLRPTVGGTVFAPPLSHPV